MDSVIAGILHGVAFFLIVGPISFASVLQLGFIIKPLTLLSVTLGHSHLHISYGRLLNHLFISPAHHQIHHSANPAHFNKNNGSLLAIWDYIFGTLYLPTVGSKLSYGLSPSEKNIHHSVKSFYIEPLISLYSYFKPGRF